MSNNKYTKKWRKNKPWSVTYHNVKTRCENPNFPKYRNYGGRGIKLLMTISDFEKLWLRDKAYLMKEPSIDRKDNDGDYTYSNCRYIEMVDNRPQLNGRWSLKYERCIICGTTKSRHQARGACNKCYQKR